MEKGLVKSFNDLSESAQLCLSHKMMAAVLYVGSLLLTVIEYYLEYFHMIFKSGEGIVDINILVRLTEEFRLCLENL